MIYFQGDFGPIACLEVISYFCKSMHEGKKKYKQVCFLFCHSVLEQI